MTTRRTARTPKAILSVYARYNLCVSRVSWFLVAQLKMHRLTGALGRRGSHLFSMGDSLPFVLSLQPPCHVTGSIAADQSTSDDYMLCNGMHFQRHVTTF